MTEYRYDRASEVPSGPVVFRMINAGKLNHRPLLLRLTEDMPPIDVQLRGSERRAANPFAGISNRRPGQEGSFSVELAQGTRYAFICFARDRDADSHALKGMTWEFKTPGESGSENQYQTPGAK